MFYLTYTALDANKYCFLGAIGHIFSNLACKNKCFPPARLSGLNYELVC